MFWFHGNQKSVAKIRSICAHHVTGSFSFSQERWKSSLHAAWITASISKPGLRPRKRNCPSKMKWQGNLYSRTCHLFDFFIWQLYFSKLWCWNMCSLLIEYQWAECLKPVNMLSGVLLTAPVRKFHPFHATIDTVQFLLAPCTPVSPCLTYSIPPSLTHTS